MDDYIGKPIQVEELVQALKKCGGIRVDKVAEIPQEKEEEAVTDKVLDPQALASLLAVIGGDKTMLAELIDSFLSEAPRLFAGLHEALEQKDAAKLRMSAHTIKSSARDFGALTLNQLCQELEDRGNAGELDDAPQRVAAIETEYRQVQTALAAAAIQYRDVKKLREA
jgi:HPt (histidine-containing phosphotransfer) domain-containing protein